MKRTGNTASNKVYNPKNIKPPIPLDVDEVDSAMERFIRQKYEQRILVDGKPRPPSRNNTGGRSSEDSPPPLPPKTGKRFGFTLRAHSAQYPVKSAMLPPTPVRVDVNNPSRVYTVSGADDTFEAKLVTLREMGFPDDKRNSTVLKGLSGDLERTIESLVRLGEASRHSSRVPTPSVTPRRGNFDAVEVNKEPPKPATKSTNPFDVPTPAASQNQKQDFGLSFGSPESPTQTQPQALTFVPQQTTRSVAYNPFDVPSQPTAQTQTIEQAFQSMQISRPLFPNSTGGYPSQQLQMQQARYQQSMTPPVPFLPQQYQFVSTPPPITGNSNPFFQTPPAQPTSANPFFAQPQFPSSNPFFSQLPSLNAQVQPQLQTQSPILQQNPQLPAQPQFQAPQQQMSQHVPQSQIPQPQHQYSAQQPFTQPSVTHSQPQQFFQQPQQPQQQPQPTQPFLPQQTGRIDKNSILALYNFPQLAPSPLPATTPLDQNQATTSATPATPQRSVPMPLTFPATNTATSSAPTVTSATGSRNPFLRAGAGKIEPIMEQPEIARHMSRESVDVQNLQPGRHSPDAFASLSARFVR
jgi:hypothetical protein